MHPAMFRMAEWHKELQLCHCQCLDVARAAKPRHDPVVSKAVCLADVEYLLERTWPTSTTGKVMRPAKMVATLSRPGGNLPSA